MNKKNTLNYPKVAAMGFFSKGLKNEFETAMANEPSVFEPLKFYCIPIQNSDFFQAFPSSFFFFFKKKEHFPLQISKYDGEWRTTIPNFQ